MDPPKGLLAAGVPRDRSVAAAHGRFSRGQAVVELALVLPFVLLVTLGVVDVARLFSAYVALNDGVREAALFAGDGDGYTKWCAIPPADVIACPAESAGHEFPNPDNIAYQIQFDAVGLDPARVTMVAPVCVPDPCGGTGSVTVVVSYRFALVTPILSQVLGDGVTITASTTAKVLP
ncbi:MAG TPA: TadE family protein [Candidatus Eisenbacteria bacterium]|nr:TadE family protein [Candidatus Eisenbacteria bacterium]